MPKLYPDLGVKSGAKYRDPNVDVPEPKNHKVPGGMSNVT